MGRRPPQVGFEPGPRRRRERQEVNDAAPAHSGSDHAHARLGGACAQARARHDQAGDPGHPSGKSADYRPDLVGRTAIELAWHIVASEKRFLGAIAAGGFDFSPIPRPESITTPIGVCPPGSTRPSRRAFRSSKPSGGAAGQGPRLPRPVPGPGGHLHPDLHEPHHPPSRPAHHVPSAHGAKVPSIYGESYDATQDRLAREGKAK